MSSLPQVNQSPTMDAGRMAMVPLPPIGSPTNISPRAGHKYEGLSGPKYSLGGGKNVKYQLPSPSFLKPFQDTKAGALETWPAHATGQGGSMTSVALTKEKHLRVMDEEAQGKAAMVPKPKFLEQLENFLKKELKALGVAEVAASELRLQAHREVFEYLIEDFKTYKPLLSSIKNEYEMMLAYQREHIRQMEPLKQMLVTVSEQCDQKVMALRDEEKQEIVDLKQENKRLYKKIDTLRQEQVSLETQVEQLQEELAAEYLRYRDECDARKMLVADINDLRYQQEDALMSKQSMEELEEGEQDDPVTLKIALKKAREDEASASKRLNEMVANYGDVIPRRDFEALSKQHGELQEQLSQTQDDFQKLKDEHDILLDKYRQVVQQRDEYYIECENLRRSATPRPEWGRCADHVAGGHLRWKELSEAKTSDQLVDVLLSEISGGSGSDGIGAEYFDGMGTGEEVAKYLQYEGKIRNRRLGKRDCALLVKDIWREKVAHDAEKSDEQRESMPEFLHLYLQRRFGLQQMVVEWAYNLHDACQRYSHDEQIGLFWGVLIGETDEEIYHSQIQMVARLLNELTKVDVEKGNQGTLSKEDFQAVHQAYFPHRNEESILLLIRAAENQLDAKEEEVLEYKNLFMEDDEGKTGAFLDEIRKQFGEDRMAYIEDIKVELGDMTPVSVTDLKKSFTMADPEINLPDLERYLCWTYNTDKEGLDSAQPIELSNLVERLRHGNLKRAGPRP